MSPVNEVQRRRHRRRRTYRQAIVNANAANISDVATCQNRGSVSAFMSGFGARTRPPNPDMKGLARQNSQRVWPGGLPFSKPSTLFGVTS